MYRSKKNNSLTCCRLLAALALLAAGAAGAQPAGGVVVATLPQAFAAAWARQPEAQSLDTRRDAAAARRQAAASWLSEAPALELSGKTDRVNGNDGEREYVAGLALPLWLPGERAHAGALAEAEEQATLSRAAAARLRSAAVVREAWWNWQRAQGEQGLAQARLSAARQLADDVARRVRAGDLARADQHQAAGAVAAAEFAVAEAATAAAAARQQLRAVTGQLPEAATATHAEVLPAEVAARDEPHPAVAELADRAAVARRSAELAGVQTRAHPELTVQTARERAVAGDDWAQSVTLGVRIPFGSASRHRASSGLARAEAIEAEGQARLEGERLAAEGEAARQRVEATRQQQAAADKRARLAGEARSFFEKSFRLGESDLPTRLRIELEAVEAERQALRAQVDHAAAISALRQALGLLPE